MRHQVTGLPGRHG